MLLTPLLLFGAILVAVVLWNRLFTPVPWPVALLLCALVALYQGETLFTSKVDIPGRITNSVFPWKALGGEPVRANTGIVVTELVPWTAAARRQLLAGEMPLWNRGLGAGSPLLADQQTASLHPFTLLGLALPIGKAWTLSVGLRLFFCLWFLFVFLRDWQLPTAASLFGAVTYTFCTFHVIWLLFPLGLATMAMPAVLVGTTELLRRPRWRAFLLLTAALALAVLGGHPESALYVGVTAGAYAVYLAFTEPLPAGKRVARLAVAAAAAAAAVLLTAPSWLPTLAVLPLSNRYQAFQGLAEHPPARRVNNEWLLPLLAPNVLGTVQSGTYERPSSDRSVPADYGEVASGYAGAATLALALAGLASLRRRPLPFFLGAMAVVLLTIAEVPGWYPLFCRLPLLGIALHQRLRFLWALGTVVAASAALAALATSRDGWAPVRRGLIAAAVLIAAVYALRWHDLAERDAGGVALSGLAVSLGVLLLLGLLAAARARPSAFAAAATALTFLELAALTWRYNPPVRPSEVLPMTGAIRALQQGPVPHRVAALGATLLPDTPGYYGLEDVKTTDPVASPDYGRLLSAFLDVRPGDVNQRLNELGHPFFDFLNVSAVYAHPGASPPDPRLRQVYDGTDGVVFANPRALPRYFLAANWQVAASFEDAVRQMASIDDFRATTVVTRVPARVTRAPAVALPGHGHGAGGQVRLLAYGAGATRLAIDSQGVNLLVTSDASWPGWRVTWNGSALAPVVVNGAFLGAFLPPGSGVLELRYRPRELDLGLRLAAATVLALVLAMAFSRFRRRADRQRPIRRGPTA